MISHHSSRVFVLKIAASALLQLRPARAVHLRRQLLAVEARALEQLGVELRLDRADRDVLAVRASRRRRRSARRCRAGSCRARRSSSPTARMPWNIVISSAAPSTIAASTTWPLPERSRSSSAQTMPKASSMPAAAEVADQVQRRHRRLAAAADRLERAGERDVVDVVPGGLRQRAVLAPARSCGRRRAAGCARGRRRARGRAAPSRRGGSPRAGRRRAPTSRSTVSTPASLFRSTAMQRRPRASRSPDASPGATRARRSTRTTSAPMSASIIAQNGPGADAGDLDDSHPRERSHRRRAYGRRRRPGKPRYRGITQANLRWETASCREHSDQSRHHRRR